MANHSIGSLEFYRNPYTMTIPESQKTVAEVPTFGGSAIFQWGAILEGSQVELTWKWMTEADYASLRAMYISLETQTWDPDNDTLYTIIITNLKGNYFEAALDAVPYRKDVKATLSIRGTL